MMTTACQVCHEEHANADDLTTCDDGMTRCHSCAYNDDFCKECGSVDISFGTDDEALAWMVGLCRDCRNEAWSTYQDDMAIDAYYHGGRG
jgi:hypothetical protein